MSKPTLAQKEAAKAKRQRIRDLAKKIAAMSVEEQGQLTKGNIATIEGHALSIVNQCLVAMQGCRSNVVGGFNQWKKAGRMVRKGEHGHSIWIPTVHTKEDDNGRETNETGFVLGTVFGIDQTEPLESQAEPCN